MAILVITEMSPTKQAETLRALCRAIAECPDEGVLEDIAEELLTAMMDCMDEQDGDDAYGTEGWQHYFGFK